MRAWPLEWINGAQLSPGLVAREVEALRSRSAHAYAVDDATGAAMSMALRDALFEHGANISGDDVLCDQAEFYAAAFG